MAVFILMKIWHAKGDSVKTFAGKHNKSCEKSYRAKHTKSFKVKTYVLIDIIIDKVSVEE